MDYCHLPQEGGEVVVNVDDKVLQVLYQGELGPQEMVSR